MVFNVIILYASSCVLYHTTRARSVNLFVLQTTRRKLRSVFKFLVYSTINVCEYFRHSTKCILNKSRALHEYFVQDTLLSPFVYEIWDRQRTRRSGSTNLTTRHTILLLLAHTRSHTLIRHSAKRGSARLILYEVSWIGAGTSHTRRAKLFFPLCRIHKHVGKLRRHPNKN